MASIRAKGKGYEARVSLNGCQFSKTHPTHERAQRWATGIELGFINPTSKLSASWMTFKEACEKYAIEVIPTHKGASQELYRIKQLIALPFAEKRLSNVTPDDLKNYRDKLVGRGLSNSTVRLSLALISAVYAHAHREWGVATDNPVRAIKKPKVAKPRSRRLSSDEEIRLMHALDGCRNPHVKRVINLLLETGLRKSEALGLQWNDIDLKRKLITLADSKNGAGRIVPISTATRDELQANTKHYSCPFPITASALNQSWSHAIRRAGITNLRIHDLRGESLTRWANLLGGDIFLLSSISGHKSLSMLKKYVNPSIAETLAKTLDHARATD